MTLPQEIETERLLLRRVSANYVQDIYNNFTDEVTTFMYPSSPSNPKETAEWVSGSINKIENGTDFIFVILKKDTEEFLGGGGLHNIHTKTPELGIWLKESAWGNKYGLEAMKSTISWARENLNSDYIVYPVDRRNVASRKIPEALGGETDNVVRECTTPTNKKLEIVEYRIYSH